MVTRTIRADAVVVLIASLFAAGPAGSAPADTPGSDAVSVAAMEGAFSDLLEVVSSAGHAAAVPDVSALQLLVRQALELAAPGCRLRDVTALAASPVSPEVSPSLQAYLLAKYTDTLGSATTSWAADLCRAWGGKSDASVVLLLWVIDTAAGQDIVHSVAVLDTDSAPIYDSMLADIPVSVEATSPAGPSSLAPSVTGTVDPHDGDWITAEFRVSGNLGKVTLVYVVGLEVEAAPYVTPTTNDGQLAGTLTVQCGKRDPSGIPPSGKPAVYFGTGGVAFTGSLGTNIVRVFDLTVASTGANEKTLRRNGISYEKSYTHPASHAGYYPGAVPMVMKLLFSPESGRIFRGQVLGVDGVDKRIDVLATAVRARMSAHDLAELDLAYAPQFGSAKDALNIAGYVANNVVEGDIELFHADELDALRADNTFLLDVRTTGEFDRGRIDGAVNIPIDEIRNRWAELPKDKLLLVYCLTGIRSYFACRILVQKGFLARNLSGGYVIYCAVNPTRCREIPGLRRWTRLLALETFCSTPQERQILHRNEKTGG